MSECIKSLNRMFFENLYRFEKDNLWGQIYMYIVQESEFSFRDLKCNDGKIIQNTIYNRYTDIIPYDHSRVKLKDKNPEQTDYINASIINIESANRVYIACQNPLRNTTHHFWQMMYETSSPIIVMLNKTSERSDAIQYWPIQKHSVKYENYHITNNFEQNFKSFTMRELELTKLIPGSQIENNNKRKIFHMSFTNWPDFGLPENVDEFLRFVSETANMYKFAIEDSKAPIVVHCSAGVGRTGTYMLVDACLSQIKIKNSLDEIDPVYLLTDMRQFRKHLIQTPEQFRFAYLSIAKGVELYYPYLFKSKSQIPIKKQSGCSQEKSEASTEDISTASEKLSGIVSENSISSNEDDIQSTKIESHKKSQNLTKNKQLNNNVPKNKIENDKNCRKKGILDFDISQTSDFFKTKSIPKKQSTVEINDSSDSVQSLEISDDNDDDDSLIVNNKSKRHNSPYKKH